MKIQIYEGCTAHNVVIDGKSTKDMTSTEQDMMVEEVLQKTREAIMRGQMSLIELIEMFQYDEFIVGPKCEQCDERVTTTVYNL